MATITIPGCERPSTTTDAAEDGGPAKCGRESLRTCDRCKTPLCCDHVCIVKSRPTLAGPLTIYDLCDNCRESGLFVRLLPLKARKKNNAAGESEGNI